MVVRTFTETGQTTREDLEVFLRNSGLVRKPWHKYIKFKILYFPHIMFYLFFIASNSLNSVSMCNLESLYNHNYQTSIYKLALFLFET